MRATRWACRLSALQAFLLLADPARAALERKAAPAAVAAAAAAAAAGAGACHTAEPGDECYDAVVWAMEQGIFTHPTWYPGLRPNSSFEDFQALLRRGGDGDALPLLGGGLPPGGCGIPCTALAPSSEAQCHTASPGEECYSAVIWAMQYGIVEHPDWYPGLGRASSFEEFQDLLFRGGYGALHDGEPGYSGCGRPCSLGLNSSDDDEEDNSTTTTTTTTAFCGIGDWQETSEVAGGRHNWCRVHVPPAGWTLDGCRAPGPRLNITVLTYNLYWWNLFGRGTGGEAAALIGGGGGGGGGSAAALLGGREQQLGDPHDFMGFQECEDVRVVLERAGLLGQFGFLQGQYALAIAYRLPEWELIEEGFKDVAEDRRSQWYGLRGAQWARLRHQSTNKTVFFANHHGPLPMNTGGRCGLRATAFNLLRLMATAARRGDALLLVGDFNSNLATATLGHLASRLHRVLSGTVFGGVDHIFCSCGPCDVVNASDLGSGGSDHHALAAEIEI